MPPLEAYRRSLLYSYAPGLFHTLEALKRAGTEPVLTKDGRIHVNCNGKNITVKTGPKE